MASLVIVDGPAEGKHLALGDSRLVMIGRDEQCTFQVLDNQVSRKHMQIRLDSGTGQHFARDHGSANGVFVNGQRLSDEMLLEEGDHIRIGDSSIVYSGEDYEDAEAAMRGVRHLGERWRSTMPGQRDGGDG